MSARRVLLAAVVLAFGGAAVGGMLWGLLNTPESNALMLALSGLLVVLMILIAGYSLTSATSVMTGHWNGLGPQPAALRKFVTGLLCFAVLWWISRLAADWWLAYRGEADAIILLRLGTARTQGLHRLVSLALWVLRWSVGLSILANLAVAGALLIRTRFTIAASLRPSSLAATGLGALVIGQGLWRLVYWRPAGLGANTTELAFVVVKLLVLYGAASIVVAIVLAWVARELLKRQRQGPPTAIAVSSNVAPRPA